MGEIIQLLENRSANVSENERDAAFRLQTCWQDIKSNLKAENPQAQLFQTTSQGFLNFEADDPLLASSVLPPVRPKDKHELAKASPAKEEEKSHERMTDHSPSKHSSQSDNSKS